MIVTLGRSALHTKQGLCMVTYARGWMRMCMKFWDEILLKGGECETLRKSNFLKNGKMVILVKIQNFSRSRMIKRTLPLQSSHEILLPCQLSLNSEIVEISCFSRHQVSGAVKWV